MYVFICENNIGLQDTVIYFAFDIEGFVTDIRFNNKKSTFKIRQVVRHKKCVSFFMGLQLRFQMSIFVVPNLLSHEGTYQLFYVKPTLKNIKKHCNIKRWFEVRDGCKFCKYEPKVKQRNWLCLLFFSVFFATMMNWVKGQHTNDIKSQCI